MQQPKMMSIRKVRMQAQSSTRTTPTPHLVLTGEQKVPPREARPRYGKDAVVHESTQERVPVRRTVLRPDGAP